MLGALASSDKASCRGGGGGGKSALLGIFSPLIFHASVLFLSANENKSPSPLSRISETCWIDLKGATLADVGSGDVVRWYRTGMAVT